MELVATFGVVRRVKVLLKPPPPASRVRKKKVKKGKPPEIWDLKKPGEGYQMVE